MQAWAADKPARPNIIVISTDDQGYFDLGCQGCKDIPTPHIDSLATNGVRCTNGYVSAPQCAPSRAGLVTGRHQQRFGFEENPPNSADERYGLRVGEATMADVLKARGYRTACVGKWHLGRNMRFHPTRRGFDEFFGFQAGHEDASGAKTADPEKLSKFTATYARFVRGTKLEQASQYFADAFADEAVGFIERNHDKPFFLFFSHSAPHVPLLATDKYLQRVSGIKDERRRTYAAMMCAVDDGVGRILETLRRHKQEENTLIFFLSDNGGPTEEPDKGANAANGSRNDPLSGRKGTLSEGGIRVPFLIQWKGHLPAGTIYGQPVISLDIFPTALAAVGVAIPDKVTLDGVNLLPFLRGENKRSPHEKLFWRYYQRDLWAVREGSLKLLFDRRGSPQLFDLSNDIGETRDLAANQPERVARMRKDYEAWNATLIKPLWNSSGSD